MTVRGIDHIALPTDDAERLLAFYLAHGFGSEHVDEWRAGTMPIFSIVCGDQKVNVHPEAMVTHRSNPAYLRGPTAEPGCGDARSSSNSLAALSEWVLKPSENRA